jgi:hypothetical protein
VTDVAWCIPFCREVTDLLQRHALGDETLLPASASDSTTNPGPYMQGMHLLGRATELRWQFIANLGWNWAGSVGTIHPELVAWVLVNCVTANVEYPLIVSEAVTNVKSGEFFVTQLLDNGERRPSELLPSSERDSHRSPNPLAVC